MRQIFNRPIPVGLFAVVIVLACGLFALSYFRQGDHFKRMDDFMAAGGRFTLEAGNKHNARIISLEDDRAILQWRVDDLEARLAIVQEEMIEWRKQNAR